MGACASIRDVLLMEEIREGGETGSEGLTESDSESEVIQNEFVALPRACQRVGVPGFLKRTYGVDLASEASLERRCKSAKLDEQLDGLRAVLPDVASRSKERKNVVLDAYHYIASLQRQVEDLNAELREDASADAAQAIEEQSCEGQWSLSCLSGLRQQPIVDVARQDGLLEVRIVCANRPGLLVDVMEAVESRGFTIMQARIACHNEIVVEYLSLENEDSESLLTGGDQKAESVEEEDEEVDRVKAMLVLAICQGEFDSDDL
ncbi:hypothetical protein M758_11G151300 [Ceratodon purpureus]|nr:hypothetical protein M758_11G151300 [Ceratodon purpureus]